MLAWPAVGRSGLHAPYSMIFWRAHAAAEPATGNERSRGVTQLIRRERFGRFRLISNAASHVCISTERSMTLEKPLASSHAQASGVWSTNGSVAAVTTTSSRPLTLVMLRFTRDEKPLCMEPPVELSGGSTGAMRSKKYVVSFCPQERFLAIVVVFWHGPRNMVQGGSEKVLPRAISRFGPYFSRASSKG